MFESSVTARDRKALTALEIAIEKKRREEAQKQETREEIREDHDPELELPELEPTKVLDALYVRYGAMSVQEIHQALNDQLTEGQIKQILDHEKDAVQAASGKWWHRLHQPW